MLGKGVVNNADQGPLLMGESEGYRNIGMSMDEVGSSIDWVDDESRLIGQPTGLCSFFPEKAEYRQSADGFEGLGEAGRYTSSRDKPF